MLNEEHRSFRLGCPCHRSRARRILQARLRAVKAKLVAPVTWLAGTLDVALLTSCGKRPVQKTFRLFITITVWVALTVSDGLDALAGPGQNTQPDAVPSREYLVKAAFLYNFAKFTEWPKGAFPDPLAPLRLCVLGEDPFHAALDVIEGKNVKNRTLVIRRLGQIKDVEKCHLVFISASEKEHLEECLEPLRDRSVLTISDMPDFAQAGGIIELETMKNKIRFQINMGVAERARLKFSSKLLSLAEIVRSDHSGASK